MSKYWARLKNSYSPWLVGIVLLATFLRFYNIRSIPSGLYWDEAVIGYDAWGISIDGVDQWGTSFPLVFKSYGDGKMPLLHYLLAGWFLIFGFDPYAIRYIAGFFGILLVIGIFFLVKKIFTSRALPIISALLVTTSSWAIHFSRFGLEAGVAVTLMVWGIYFLYQSRSKRDSVLGILLLSLSAYTYHAILVLSPLLLLLLGIRKWRVLFFGLSLIPLLLAFAQTDWSRAEQTLFWKNPEYSFNPVSVTQQVGIRVIQHVSPSFLLQTQQTNLRQVVPGYFILFPVEILFLLVGLAASLQLSRRQKTLLWGWLIVGIIPSVIGDPSPHTIRAFGWMPLLKIIEALGLMALWRWRKVVPVVFLVWYLISLVSFWNYYQTHYVQISQADFQSGYAELMQSLKKIGNINHDNFVISPAYGQPYVYTLIYWQISPPDYRAGGLANVSFRPIQWPEDQNGLLFAGSPNEIAPHDSRVLEVVYSVDNDKPVWVIAR